MRSQLAAVGVAALVLTALPVPASPAPLPVAWVDASLGCGPAAPGERPGAAGFARLAPAVVALARDPFAPVRALPPTALEAQEPGRLYALVTRERAVDPADYAPDDLVPLFGGPYRARAEVAEHLALLFEAARAAGHPTLVVTSGFRDHLTQAGTYEDWVRRSGPAEADRVSAKAGHSEHQLGLAVDVSGACGGFACFRGSPESLWVAEHAHRFGFIVRYPEGGEEVTGYAYEPWHLRYVGPRAAWAMHLRGEVYWDRFAPLAVAAAGLR